MTKTAPAYKPCFLTNKKLLIVMLVVIGGLIVDTIITKISVFMSQELVSIWRNVVFFILSAIFVVGQYFFLVYVKSRNRSVIKKDQSIDNIHKGVTIAQYGLAVILLLSISQIIVVSYYNVSLLKGAMSISYTLAIILLGFLAQRFFSWYKSNANRVVLLYGISASLLSINAALTLAFSIILLQDKPELVLPHVGTLLPIFEPGSLKDIINKSYIITSIISFLITWIATTLLLRHYSEKLGKIKYWFVVSLPLIYFLSQFLDLILGLFEPLVEMSPVLHSTLLIAIFALSKPAGGILFGVAFWSAVRNVRDKMVRDYMIIAAYGLVLVFISNQAISAVNSPFFPPFGLVTISFMGLASYLMLVGIYYSAISASQDVELRRSIRRYAFDELSLLRSIGSAELRAKLENGVKGILQKVQGKMLEETGFQSSLNEEDAKEYLDEVLKERARKEPEV